MNTDIDDKTVYSSTEVIVSVMVLLLAWLTISTEGIHVLGIYPSPQLQRGHIPREPGV